MIDDKESDEKDQISKKLWWKNNWRYINHDTEKFEFKETKYISWGKIGQINSKDMSDNKESY